MRKWEYLYVFERSNDYVSGDEIVSKDDVGDIWNYANLLGEEGWEMMWVTSDEYFWQLVFKRPFEDDDEEDE